MFKFLGFIFICLSMSIQANQIHLDVQKYPVGLITSMNYEWEMPEYRIGAGLAFNTADREDNGENDNEEGDGFGLSLYYQRDFSYKNHSLFWGARAELFDFDVEYTNSAGPNGVSETLIFQPTFEIGKTWSLDENLFLDLSVAGGMEINLKEDQDVGEGAIGLIRLGLSYKI